ncbi:hypothetical protein [Aquitalea aquatica]|uniref:Uncharacterized protein n=1 Tax=Aquitalea aquatica TaxID=3044273 RepID=A0A838Y8E5_9NEIS|nr:hypothetical protein [Aquitalea magnusonii]MBA4708839.1 hypothetical protein [Aquitalea magnusonii]
MIGTILNIFSVVHARIQFIEYKDYLPDSPASCGLPASRSVAVIAATRRRWRLAVLLHGLHIERDTAPSLRQNGKHWFRTIQPQPIIQ